MCCAGVAYLMRTVRANREIAVLIAVDPQADGFGWLLSWSDEQVEAVVPPEFANRIGTAGQARVPSARRARRLRPTSARCGGTQRGVTEQRLGRATSARGGGGETGQ